MSYFRPLKIYLSEIEESNFIKEDSYHKTSLHLKKLIFLGYIKEAGLQYESDANYSDDEYFQITTDDPTFIFKLLYPNGKWNYYMSVQYPQLVAAHKYLMSHHSDGSMCLFESGEFYAGFETEAAAMLFKLTLV